MLDKKYDHVLVEGKKYDLWLEKGYFHSGKLDKQPFTIVIPPPNVTGNLHLGHAWDTTLQDIIIRYKRMDGYDALWLPGMDHAGIATQAKVDKKLKEMGFKPREMNRDEWLKYAWEWKEEYASNIHRQWAKMGLSLDYSKERFTLDEGLSDAVKHVFITLYNKGFIYRGERIINWDPEAMTALSNEEVIYKEVKGAFYYLKYKFENSNEYLEVATTRPETLFGDTAVAVNPKDKRYQHLIGKKVVLPVINKLIPVIGDDYADMEFGTGVVKITPAHDPNDFEVGNRHQLERIKVIHPDGTMNENAGIYNGLNRFDARGKLIEDLKGQDLLIKVEEMIHSVGHSERTDVMVEPYLSKQWFVKMDVLAKQVLENQKTDHKVRFIPSRFEKIMNHWMENCHDWCISRQLWWGHRIPAWYKGEEVFVGYEAPKGEGWTQDQDVLDTWFSSALWPFSTLGWPNHLDTRYFPNNVLVTGYDIIFFWVSRMVFQSLEFTKEIPFKECLIHGLVRDAQGRKMSKSLGNGVDPMDVISEYGADALRYFLTTSSAPGQDLRYDTEKVKSTWNFINKLWNASRFVLMNLEGFKETDYSLEDLKEEDQWILSKLNKTVKEVRKYMDKYEFNNVGSVLYSFIWDDFCDNYIEMSKFSSNHHSTKSTLYYVLKQIIKMLHPFMPYVTDELYQVLPFKDAENIMISSFPEYNPKLNFHEVKERVEQAIDFIKIFRNFKAEKGMGKDYQIYLKDQEPYPLIINMLKCADHIIEQPISKTFYLLSSGIYEMIIYFEKEETEEERVLKQKQIESLQSSIERRKNLLMNENYVKKAPRQLVEQEQTKLDEEEKLLDQLKK